MALPEPHGKSTTFFSLVQPLALDPWVLWAPGPSGPQMDDGGPCPMGPWAPPYGPLGPWSMGPVPMDPHKAHMPFCPV